MKNKDLIFNRKKDELFHLEEVFKNLQSLHLMYLNFYSENKNRVWHTETSLNNTFNEIKRVSKELEEISSET